MKIAMLTSETNPYAKTGGLADVVYALSESLSKLEQEVIVVLPAYLSVLERNPKLTKKGSFFVYMSWRKQCADIYYKKKNGITYYFIGNDYYFGRDRLYGYDDDGERFAFFSLAARKLLKFINFQADIVHVHDWQTAIVPTLIREQNADDPFYKKMRFVLTIHNPSFKGMLDRFFVNDFFGLDDALFDQGKIRFQGMFSTLKSGIIYADKITTVSPTHREELLCEESGQGLASVLSLRKRDFLGILNGIDLEEWNPNKDRFISHSYSSKNLEEGKRLNQSDLLRSFNIHWYGGPVYGLVSRLSWQKGIDLVLGSLNKELEKGASLVILGSGEDNLERKCQTLRDRFPGTVGLFIGYSNELAHKIYAGSDFFLMPSLFEPCGISQMIAQRYGTLPIVRATGGLKDTVTPFLGFPNNSASGIVFNDYNEAGLDYGIGMARSLYADQSLYYAIARNAMKLDHGWETSAREYLRLYQEA